MVKKLITIAAVGVVAKLVLDKVTGSGNDADLWAEATDPVESTH